MCIYSPGTLDYVLLGSFLALYSTTTRSRVLKRLSCLLTALPDGRRVENGQGLDLNLISFSGSRGLLFNINFTTAGTTNWSSSGDWVVM